MIRRLLAFSVVSIALATAASAQEAVSPSGSHSSYTHSQLKQRILGNSTARSRTTIPACNGNTSSRLRKKGKSGYDGARTSSGREPKPQDPWTHRAMLINPICPRPPRLSPPPPSMANWPRLNHLHQSARRKTRKEEQARCRGKKGREQDL
jgi:hypothetical protein